jgi:hypothetical protein
MRLRSGSVMGLVCGFAALAISARAEQSTTKLASWYDALGQPRPSESFGRYLARTARIQHGVKYEENSKPPGAETLDANVDAFECVSFIESTLAVARCAWESEPTASCFVRELEATRYRSGHMGDYASRLHYFVDWIGDNESRGRLVNMTAALGGEPVRKDFFYITERVLERADVQEDDLASLTREMQTTEARLSATTHAVLTRQSAPPVLSELEDGDLVAIVRERPGLLVNHAGFVYWANGTPRLLHASSYHGRVVITVEDLTNYLLRRPERRGVIVARPIVPQKH